MIAHRLAAGSAALLSALALPVAATDGAFTELVATRQAAFEDMGGAIKVFRDQLRGDAAFDLGEQADAAAVVAGHAPGIVDWFPAGSGADDGYDTDALAYIWRNREKFDRLAGELVPKAGALEAAVATGERGEILQAFRALGGTCGDCHDSYRAD